MCEATCYVVCIIKLLLPEILWHFLHLPCNKSRSKMRVDAMRSARSPRRGWTRALRRDVYIPTLTPGNGQPQNHTPDTSQDPTSQSSCHVHITLDKFSLYLSSAHLGTWHDNENQQWILPLREFINYRRKNIHRIKSSRAVRPHSRRESWAHPPYSAACGEGTVSPHGRGPCGRTGTGVTAQTQRSRKSLKLPVHTQGCE